MPCKDENQFTENDIQDLTGYVVIVTGGNSGFGLETTRHLALRNARVYIASRSEERVYKAIDELNKDAGKQLDLHLLKLDLLDLASVKAAAKSFLQREARLDVLINNAGIMNAPYKLTKDGFETQWQTNYVAVQLLISQLMPLLLATAKASGSLTRVRVVNVCSDLAVRLPVKEINFDDLNMTSDKGMLAVQHRYSHSKQAEIRLSNLINDRYSSQGVTAYSCHPGIAKTGLQAADPTVLGTFTRFFMHVGASHTTLTGAYSSLYLATSPQAPAEGAGRYYEPNAKLSKHELPLKWFAEKEVNARLYEETERAFQKY